MTRTFPLSVLDQSPISEGMTAAEALANTLDLARAADALGYRRYWLAEHHASPSLAGVAPEALIGPVALATSRIRVGSGGIMLPHFSPFKVAETFRMLAALAPDRIDLGVGRAPGSDQRAAYALQRDRSRRMPSNDFPETLAELLAYLDDSLPADHPFAPLTATLPSGGGASPVPWLLGSSPDSARWAAEAGLPYCIADFINPGGIELARLYRRQFTPSPRLAAPHVMIATLVIAAPTREEAERLAAPTRMMMAYLQSGRPIPIPSVDRAMAWLGENPLAGRMDRRMTFGAPGEVRRQLDQLAEDYGADELMLVNILPDHASRIRSYALIAAEYELAGAENGLASLPVAA